LRGGFGHIAVNHPDVFALSRELATQGVDFKKKPDEGRMKGLAFAYDPDRYWVEIVSRSQKYPFKQRQNFSQVMLRIKDPSKSIPFYRDLLQMSVVRELHFPKGKGDFSLYFMATLTEKEKAAQPDPKSDAARDFVKSLHNPTIELTHNHGTENEDGPVYHTGNTDSFGFGHIGFLVDDVYKTCDAMEKAGVKFHKKPDARSGPFGRIRSFDQHGDDNGRFVDEQRRGRFGPIGRTDPTADPTKQGRSNRGPIG